MYGPPPMTRQKTELLLARAVQVLSTDWDWLQDFAAEDADRNLAKEANRGKAGTAHRRSSAQIRTAISYD